MAVIAKHNTFKMIPDPKYVLLSIKTLSQKNKKKIKDSSQKARCFNDVVATKGKTEE